MIDARGTCVGVQIISTDVTERRSAEEEAQKLASIVRHSGELVNLADPEGKMIFLNEAGGRMLGLDPDKIEGMSVLEVIPEHLRDLVREELLRTLRERAPGKASCNTGTFEPASLSKSTPAPSPSPTRPAERSSTWPTSPATSPSRNAPNAP